MTDQPNPRGSSGRLDVGVRYQALFEDREGL